MKLWLVLYVGQAIGATWGPLPYDKTECKIRAAEQHLRIELMLQNPEGMKEKGLKAEELRKMRFECVEQPYRPFTLEA